MTQTLYLKEPIQLMVNASPFSPALLKENIFFLTAGSCTSSICVLLFDRRLYTTGDIFLLFIAVLLSFIVQAFAASMKNFISNSAAILLYIQSLAINFIILALFYWFILPFPTDLFLTFKFCLLVTFIQTSFYFFIRYKNQYGLNREAEKLIGNVLKQQQVKELEVLKQQIDPHFIFNSFNTLAYLIDDNSDKARQFSNKLANVYRYIIFNSSKNLVSLADEAGFAKDYAFLQEIRHSNEIQIRFAGFDEVDNLFIVPVSIQILIENAIKHNEFTEDNPLIIKVGFENNSVCVENNLNPKNYVTPSSKIGLSNLRDRFGLILGKELQVIKKDNRFKVILPLLNK